jgi:hypothetical protein
MEYSEYIEITGGDRIVEQLDLTDFANNLFFGKINPNKAIISAFLAKKCIENLNKDWKENFNNFHISDQFFFLSKISLLQDKEDKEQFLAFFVMNFCQILADHYENCEKPTQKERIEFAEFLANIFGFLAMEKDLIFIAISNIFG